MGSDAYCVPAVGLENHSGRTKASQLALENLVLGEMSDGMEACQSGCICACTLILILSCSDLNECYIFLFCF